MIKLKADQEIDRHKIVQQRQFPKRGRLLCRHRKQANNNRFKAHGKNVLSLSKLMVLK